MLQRSGVRLATRSYTRPMATRVRRGSVNGAIFDYLRTKPDGAHLSDIQAAVEKSLGRKVAPSSVRGYLNKHHGGAVERIGRGTYKMP
jgi:hypothetical protein